MSPKVFDCFRDQISKLDLAKKQNSTILEIGAGAWTLLDIFSADNTKIALNPILSKALMARKDINAIAGTSQQIPVPDNSVDVILSCSVLEHDKFFWKSLSEIRRVLRPGGYIFIGVPAFLKLPWDFLNSTLTFKRHGFAYNADFYRFSELAVSDVILDGLSQKEVILIRRWPNPYLLGIGRKDL